MDALEHDWVGYRFVALGLHDNRFIRSGGVFAFVRRAGPQRAMLFAGQADDIARATGAGHARWDEALALGMTELHVFLAPRDRTSACWCSTGFCVGSARS